MLHNVATLVRIGLDEPPPSAKPPPSKTQFAGSGAAGVGGATSFIADIIGVEDGGWLHGDGSHDLAQVILDHVAQRAGFLIIGVASFDADRFGGSDLHMIDVLRYTADVNGFDSLVITKLDVLDDLDEIPVCIAYEVGGHVM